MLVSGITLLFHYIEADNTNRERHIFYSKDIEHVNQQLKTTINSFNFIKLVVLTGHNEIHIFLETGEKHHKKNSC